MKKLQLILVISLLYNICMAQNARTSMSFLKNAATDNRIKKKHGRQVDRPDEAQDARENIAKKVSKLMELDFRKIRDSTAVYGAVLTIDVKREAKKKNHIVHFDINNREVETFFEDLEPLKKIDYTEILGKKDKIKLLYKIYILVTNSKYEAQNIDVEHIWEMLHRTSFQETTEMIILGTRTTKIDLKVYH